MKFAIADWDAPQHWKVLLPTDELIKLTKAAFLTHDWHEVDGLVVESAHLKERNTLSVAQVYTAAELNSWQPNVPVYMFPAKITKKARRELSIEKADDTLAIKTYLDSSAAPLASLKRFRTPADDHGRAAWAHRNSTREAAANMYNVFRTEKHDLGTAAIYELPIVARCAALLETAKLDKQTAELFKLRKTRNGMRFDITPVISAYCCMFDENGNVREGRAGAPIGSTYIIKDVIGLHSFGLPNLMRANYMHFKIGPADARERRCITTSVRRLLAAMRASHLAQSTTARPPQPNVMLRPSGATKCNVLAANFPLQPNHMLRPSGATNVDVLEEHPPQPSNMLRPSGATNYDVTAGNFEDKELVS